jgi:hypothetical protein
MVSYIWLPLDSLKFPAVMLSTFDYLQAEIAALQDQAGKDLNIVLMNK